MALSPLVLDVRPDLAEGQDPFAKIMQAVDQLSANQELLLIAPFEPVPLYSVLAQRGFTHSARQAAPGEWQVTFRLASAPAPGQKVQQQMPSNPPPTTAPDIGVAPAQQSIQLDTRGMEPPGPLLRILDTLEKLSAGQRLIAYIDREPLLLYPELVERGWAYEGAAQPDGSFIIRIYRPH